MFFPITHHSSLSLEFLELVRKTPFPHSDVGEEGGARDEDENDVGDEGEGSEMEIGRGIDQRSGNQIQIHSIPMDSIPFETTPPTSGE